MQSYCVGNNVIRRLQLLLLILGTTMVLRFFSLRFFSQPQPESFRPTQFNTTLIFGPDVSSAAPTSHAAHIPLAKQDEDETETSSVQENPVRTCPDCVPVQHTCQSVPEACRVNPHLPECNIKCLDGTPVDTSRYNDETSIVWPALGTGQWIVVNEADCAARINTTRPCLWQRYQWSLDGIAPLPTRSQHELCQFLRSQQFSYLRVVGDSLARHLFQSIVMILSGNSRESFGMGDDCVGTALFSEKNCRIQQSPLVMNVCRLDGMDNGSIRVEYSMHYYDTPQWKVDDTARTMTIYGAGNHPGYKRNDPLWGILNASTYIQHRWRDTQLADWIVNGTTAAAGGPALPAQPKHVLLWVPVHSKYKIWKSVETNARALDFMMETANFWQSFSVPTINTFTMTEQIVGKLCAQCPNFAKCHFFDREKCQSTLETYDGFHFGPQTNFWKAHLIFHRLRELQNNAAGAVTTTTN
jgi:hypothetical protein